MLDFERYSRNILVKQIAEEGQQKLLSSRVLVAGAGGLGSTVIANLASVGIGHIGIVDDDVLEISNLNRQYIHKFANIGKAKVDSAKNWVNEFNPDVEVKTYNLHLDEENCQDIIKDYDLIIDAFDSYASKFLLNKIAVKNSKPLVHGGVSEFSGQVMTVVSPKSACLACVLPDYDVSEEILKGVLSPSVSVIASIESQEAVKILLGIGETLENRFLSYDGFKMTFKEIKLSKNPKCPICSGF